MKSKVMTRKSIKTALGLMLSLAIMFSAIASNGLFVQAAGGKLIYAGGNAYYTDTATKTSSKDDAWVYLSKTAKDSSTKPSLGEDEFEVTLVAKTKEKLDEFLMVKDTQVLLVLDTSLSMTTYCAECGKTYATGKTPCCAHPETRLDRTKKAVASFLDSYAATASGTSAHRYVAVVEYGIQARYYQPDSSNKVNAWIDINTTVSGGTSRMSALKSWVNGLGTTAGTNTDAALAMADALLNNSAFNPYMSVENKNMVLFTDGMPNMRLTASQVLTASGKNPTPYPFPNNAGSAGTQVAYDPSKPTQSNQLVYQQPITRANSLRNKGINIFTVGYGGDGGSGSTDVYLTGWRAALQWLETLASSPENAYVVDAVSSLDDMIRSFVEIVEWAVWEGISPYVITDPMGPYFIWDTNNTLNMPGQSFAQNSFMWDLKKMPLPTKDADGWYTYTYTYKVKFDAAAANAAGYTQAFDSTAGAPLNEPTTLSFVKLVNGEINGSVKVVNFEIPKAVFTREGGAFKMKLGWMRSTEIPAESFSRPVGGQGDAWSYETAFKNTPIKYFEDETVRSVANGRVASGGEYTVNSAQQLTGMQHIWDAGTYFPLYKEQNGDASYSWASWEHHAVSGNVADKGEYSIRRFTAYLNVDASDLSNSTNILLAPDDELGNMSYLFPINDNAFIFVNGKLAFWGGTDVISGNNQYGALNRTTFGGETGVKVRNGVNEVLKNVYPHTDGWCIDLEANAEAINIKPFLTTGFNRIDIITDEYWEGGGMNKLNLYVK